MTVARPVEWPLSFVRIAALEQPGTWLPNLPGNLGNTFGDRDCPIRSQLTVGFRRPVLSPAIHKTSG